MLIDEMLASDHIIDELGGLITPSHLQQAHVIRVQNVFDYFLDQVKPKDTGSRHYSNVAPTMPIMWFEWARSNTEIMDNASCARHKASVRIGILCLSVDVQDGPSEGIEIVRRFYLEQGLSLGEETRWCTAGFVIHRILEPDKLPHVSGRVEWRIGADGQLLPSHSRGQFVSFTRIPVPDTHKKEVTNSLMEAAETSWLALSFMHCKNVKIEKSAPIPERLRRAREKKGKAPLFRHHTIVIDPSRPIQGTNSSGSELAVPRALHICRGHFKEFGESGLFGKYKGTYWWPMHTRGSSDNGTISKDYLIKGGNP